MCPVELAVIRIRHRTAITRMLHPIPQGHHTHATPRPAQPSHACLQSCTNITRMPPPSCSGITRVPHPIPLGHHTRATPHPAQPSHACHTPSCSGITHMPHPIPHGRQTCPQSCTDITHVPQPIPHGRPQDADLVVTVYTEAQRRCARSGMQ